MKREIKFRGKVKGTTSASDWVYGSLLIYGDGEHNIFVPRKHNYKLDSWNVEPSTVGQFSGLKDKNGKEIYEGDIFTVNGKYPKLVEYREDRAAFCVANVDELGKEWFDPWQQPAPDWWNDFSREIVVIGNKFDNPELYVEV